MCIFSCIKTKIANSHGRDDALRVWHIPPSSESSLSTVLPAEGYDIERTSPWLLHSVLVNTMNFCSMATAAASTTTADHTNSILFAVPGTRDGYVHIHELPSEKGIHIVPPATGIPTSLVMAIKLLIVDDTICLVVGNEAGGTSVQLFDAQKKSWDTIYASHPHSQPILSLDIAPSVGRYFTSSADAIIASHPLPKSVRDRFTGDDVRTVQTKHAGQQSLSMRDDGRVFATAGWDSRARIYSSKSMKEVAVLKWHKEGCYSVCFGSTATVVADAPEGSSAEKGMSKGESSGLVAVENQERGMTVQQRREQKTRETHWLAAGSKDGKVSLWNVF
jgi:WD40 repeat protein